MYFYEWYPLHPLWALQRAMVAIFCSTIKRPEFGPPSDWTPPQYAPHHHITSFGVVAPICIELKRAWVCLCTSAVSRGASASQISELPQHRFQESRDTPEESSGQADTDTHHWEGSSSST